MQRYLAHHIYNAQTSSPTTIIETTTSDIIFTETDIITAINELSTTSAAGPDNFPAIYLKQCKHALANPFDHIMEKIIK